MSLWLCGINTVSDLGIRPKREWLQLASRDGTQSDFVKLRETIEVSISK